MSLVKRIGFDTIARLKAAGESRFEEAQLLRNGGHLLGAIYLFGHSAECLISSAYLRSIGLNSREEISDDRRKAVLFDARTKIEKMEDEDLDLFKILWPTKTKEKLVGIERSHPIFGLSLLLTYSQREGDTVKHIKYYCAAIRRNWSPNLRYHVVNPIQSELEEVRDATQWFFKNYDKISLR